MRKRLFALIASALAVPVFAAPAAPAQPEQTQPPKKEKKICRHVVDSGSRIGTNVCKTVAEWEKDPTTTEGSHSAISGRPSGY